MNFWKVLLALVPLTVDFFNSLRISCCAENTRKTKAFCMLFMCSTDRRMMKPRIPKPTSGHLDRSFFFVSRGRIRISNLRCPEVGLEFQLEVSRGRIRILTSIFRWCVFVLSTSLHSIRDLRWTFLVSRGRFRNFRFHFGTITKSQITKT